MLRLNNAETRLNAYKDSPEVLAVKLRQLKAINQSRRAHGISPVLLDILACRVANQLVLESVRHKFMGHYNARGEPPYLRFALAGGTDHVEENVASIETTGLIPQHIDSTLRYLTLMHGEFMAEKAPHDSHRKNCLNPFHTHVGLGWAKGTHQMVYCENFIDRYLLFEPFDSVAKVDAEFSIRFKPIAAKQKPYFVRIYFLPKPKPLTPAQINSRESYPDFTNEEVLNLGPWELNTPNDNGYTLLKFTPSKKGYYYLQIFLSPKAHVKGTQATTKGKVQASGVVVQAIE